MTNITATLPAPRKGRRCPLETAAMRSPVTNSFLDFYGLPVFSAGKLIYAAATLEQAEAAAHRIAKDNLSEVRPDLLLKHAGLPPSKAAFRLIRHVQEGLYVDTQPLLAAIVTNLDKLAEEAVQAQGRQHFFDYWTSGDVLELPLISFPPHFRSAISQALAVDESEIYLYSISTWMLRSSRY